MGVFPSDYMRFRPRGCIDTALRRESTVYRGSLLAQPAASPHRSTRISPESARDGPPARRRRRSLALAARDRALP